jgi:hypothetical protein
MMQLLAGGLVSDIAPRTFTYTPVKLPDETGFSAEQTLLIADIRALEQKVIQRRLWSAPSVRELLQGAADATVHADALDKAREAFDKAEKVFQDDVQTKNRMFYLIGALFGTVTAGVMTWAVLRLAKWWGVTTLAATDTVITLFVFAGMGSAASVLTRLSTIDLKDELRKKWVVISAGTRPLLAIAFASVIYVILKGKIVAFQGFDDDEHLLPLIWVAAFLCGFSERFAVDILDRVPFTKQDGTG